MSDIVKQLRIATAIPICKPAADEIESLRRQLAEKDAEIERLKEDGNMPVKYYQPNGKGQVYAVYGTSSINFADSLLEQLAASQAREAQLREATECLLHLCDAIGMRHGPVLDKARQVLALPQDTSALEAMIAKAGEVMRERTVGVCLEDNFDLHGYIPSIRALPGVTLKDLK